jgi:putative nicotinate phosphoribosyltransferase
VPGLCTDLYELNMAASYLRRGMTGPATFSLFVRHLPADRGFMVAAGLGECLEFLERFRFDDDELAWLRSEFGFDQQAVAAFAELRFTGDVWAVPEGRVVFADEPLLEVTAPIAEAQLVETALLNHISFQTAVASKAARCRLAAGGRDDGALLCGGVRRRARGLPRVRAGLPRPHHVPGRHLRHPARGPRGDRDDRRAGAHRAAGGAAGLGRPGGAGGPGAPAAG